MPYAEAIAHGIPVKDNKRGFSAYYPPCHICGEGVYSWAYLPGNIYTCRRCKILKRVQHRSDTNKKSKMLEEALTRISLVANIRLYDDAVNQIKKSLDKSGWFERTEEIMVALELIHSGIKAYHRVKVQRYRVDYVLPDEKLVLEISGPLLSDEGNWVNQQKRKKAIIAEFGEGWDVVNISTDYVNTNVTKLMTVINTLRSTHMTKKERINANFPSWFSKTAVSL
jgi:very-short-patch-repair endonuclease